MDNGWIKLHRQIIDNPIIKKPYYLSLWILLLLKANHKDNKMIWNNQTIVIHEGQFVTGRKQLAEQSGISETTIERILDYLESEGQIGQQKTTKYRLITILNWKSYQDKDNKRTTNGQQGIQQTDTNKNVKNIKNEKNISEYNSLGAEVIKLFEVVNPACKKMYGNTTQRKACDYLINEYGFEEVSKVITILPKTNKQPFFPNITTPAQLWQKYQQLKDKLLQKKEENKSRIII